MGSCLKKREWDGYILEHTSPGDNGVTESSWRRHDYNTVIRDQVCVCVGSRERALKTAKPVFPPSLSVSKVFETGQGGCRGFSSPLQGRLETPQCLLTNSVPVNQQPHFLISPNEMLSTPRRHLLANSRFKHYEHIQYVLIAYTKNGM